MQSRSLSSVRIFYPRLSRAEVISRLQAGLKELQQKLPIVRAVLFGSYAQGRYTVSSDIDLLIVYAGPARHDAYTLVKRSLELLRVEPHLYTQAEYEKLSETIRKMTDNGIVLWESRS